jgi:putative FmdB family regulatory protein
MPLYEFYCEPCHTIFTFRSPRVDTATLPLCPRCGKKLKREVSSFAHIVRGNVPEGPEAGADGEDAADRMDRVLSQMGERMQALEDDEADPREAVRAMKELASAGGLHFNKEVQEALARIEAGEDPEKIDAEFSEVFDTDNPFADGDDDAGTSGVGWLRRLRGPARDPTWHELGSVT